MNQNDTLPIDQFRIPINLLKQCKRDAFHLYQHSPHVQNIAQTRTFKIIGVDMFGNKMSLLRYGRESPRKKQFASRPLAKIEIIGVIDDSA